MEQKRKERQDNSSDNHSLLDVIKAEPPEDTKPIDVKTEIGKHFRYTIAHKP